MTEGKEERHIIPTDAEDNVQHSEVVLLKTVCIWGLVNCTGGIESAVI